MNPVSKVELELPIITVYLTTFNRVNLLQRAVSSVLNQTFTDFELIIIDDASNDDTKCYLASLSARDKRVVIIQNDVSRGACFGRNVAINKARGKYITGLDDDDEFTSGRLSSFLKHSKMLEEGYSCIVASLVHKHKNRSIERKHNLGTVDLDLILFKNVIGNQVFTLTTNLVGINGFDEQMPAMQDYDTWVRLIAKYGPAYKVGNVSYVVNTAHEEPRITNNDNRRKAVLRFNEKHYKLMNKEHLKAAELHRIICFRECLSFKKYHSLFNVNIFPELTKYFIFSNLPILEKLKFKILGLKIR